MPPNCEPEENGDYEEYDENDLFKEYVERAEENFEDPELNTIEAILTKKGFCIKAEHLRREVLSNTHTGAKTAKIVANFTLIDSLSEEVINSLRQRTVFAPILNQEITRRDREFLKSIQMCW